MTFWLVVAALVVVGGALAWWTGGHLPGRSPEGERARQEAQSRHQVNDIFNRP